MKIRAIKAMDFLLNIICVIAVIMLISLAYSKITTGVDSFFGYRPLYCMSGSMEPTIMTGQWVLGKAVDRAEVENAEIGGIYAYFSTDFNGKKLIMHRIKDKTAEGKYIFKGDNNEEPDPVPVSPDKLHYKIVKYKGGK